MAVEDVAGGCFGCGAIIAFFALIIGTPMYCQAKARDLDDPLFRGSHTPCEHQWRNGHIEITTAGISRGCAVTRDATFKITNRLSDYPVTLCLGHRGDCMSGHPTPFRGNRLTIAPGHTEQVRFEEGKHYAVTRERNYPVTVLPVAGLNFSNLDITVRSETPPAN